MQFSLLATACRRENDKYDAEVALSKYDDNAECIWSTKNRVVSTGHSTRELAIAAAEGWLQDAVSLPFMSLKVAKP